MNKVELKWLVNGYSKNLKNNHSKANISRQISVTKILLLLKIQLKGASFLSRCLNSQVHVPAAVKHLI